MARNNSQSQAQENRSSLSQIKWTQSWTSLFLGVLVVLIAIVLVFLFARGRTYDRINTSESTVELSSPGSGEKKLPETYEVKAGDNLWTISEKLYGSGYNWVDIASANKLDNPGLIFAGNKLKVPDVPKKTLASVEKVQNNGPSVSGTSYKVVEGDHLWGISVRAYGDGFKWPELAKVNNIPNPDLIYPDVVLKLPR